MASGKNKRLVVSMPPRHGKSELVSKHLPPWWMGTFPGSRVVVASYEHNFAAWWGQQSRDLMEEWGPATFNCSVRNDSSARDEWGLTNGSTFLARGVGGPITGRGADLLVVDDPVKNAEEAFSPVLRQKAWDWWQSTVRTRVEPGGSIIVMATRWHRDDLLGRILANATDKTPWREIRIPAIAEENDAIGRAVGEPLWPSRYDAEALDQIRLDVGPYVWHALYQQSPRAEGGVEWPSECFDDFIWVDSIPQSDLICMALDPSMGKDSKVGDYSAIVVVAITSDLIYVDAIVERMNATTIVEHLYRFAEKYKPHHVGIETNQWQELLVKEATGKVAEFNGYWLSNAIKMGDPIVHIENMHKKELRIRRLSQYVMRRQLRFVRSPGCKLLVDQMRDFPAGEHDDGPDALEMAIRLPYLVFGGHEVDQAFRMSSE